MIDIFKHPSGTVVNIEHRSSTNLIIVWKKDVANGTFPPLSNQIDMDLISDEGEVFMLGEDDDGIYSPYWLFSC